MRSGHSRKTDVGAGWGRRGGTVRRRTVVVRRGVPGGLIVVVLLLGGGGYWWWSHAQGKDPLAPIRGAASQELEPGTPEEILSRFQAISPFVNADGSSKDLRGEDDARASRAYVEVHELLGDLERHLTSLRRAIDRKDAADERLWRMCLAGDLREWRAVLARHGYPVPPR